MSRTLQQELAKHYDGDGMPRKVEPVAIYCDGAFSSRDGVGAIAFSIPKLGLFEATASEGLGATRFEILAAIAGCNAALSAGSRDELNVLTDSEAVRHWIWEFNLRSANISKRIRVPASDGDLIFQMEALLKRHKVIANRVTSELCPEHHRCHMAAQEAVAALVGNRRLKGTAYAQKRRLSLRQLWHGKWRIKLSFEYE